MADKLCDRITMQSYLAQALLVRIKTELSTVGRYATGQNPLLEKTALE